MISATLLCIPYIPLMFPDLLATNIFVHRNIQLSMSFDPETSRRRKYNGLALYDPIAL